MKKRTLFLAAALAVILAAIPPAQAANQKWLFKLSGVTDGTVDPAGQTHYTTGNTTYANQTLSESGVSAMVRHNGPNPPDLKGEHFTANISGSNGLFMAHILDMDPSQAATGTSDFSSGTTGAFYVKVADVNRADHWAQADFIPVFQNMAISGTTTRATFFSVPPANYLRGYWLASGITPFETVEIELESGFQLVRPDQPEPYLISSQDLSVNSNCAGTSTFTVPEGTTWIKLCNEAHGYAVYGTSDGSAAVSGAKGYSLDPGKCDLIPASKFGERKWIGSSSTDTTMTAEYWRGNPYGN